MPHSILKILFAFISFTALAFSQNTAGDTLSSSDGFWGPSYYKGSQEISSKEFGQLLRSSPDKTVYDLYSKGKTQSTFAQVFAFGGGFCIGYGLTTKPTNAALAIAGGVVAVGAFILDNSGKNNMNEALTNYNNSLSTGALFLPHNASSDYTLVSLAFIF